MQPNVVNKENAKQKIKELVEKYNKLVREGRTLKEEATKIDFILPLFRAMGWETEDSNEVSKEEKVSKKRVDYSLRINGVPKFFLEAKGLDEDLEGYRVVDGEKITYVEQAINYAWYKAVTWAVLTNFKEIRVLNAEVKDANNQFFALTYNRFIDDFEQLWLLSKESWVAGQLDKEAEKWGKKRRKISIDEQILLDFTRFRELLTKNIATLNTIAETDLDEVVQRILNRLIFIRNVEDRELEQKILISNVREWADRGEGKRGGLYEFITKTFIEFREHYDSGLFGEVDEPPHLCESIKIDNPVLNEIIEGLYWTEDRTRSYDFSAIEADVLGNIYEQYLGHILKKTKKRAKLKENHVHKKEQGIYYTPTYIVDYIVRNTLGELLKDKKIEDVEKIRVLDPACGSGSFLIKAFDILNEYYSKKGESAQTKFDTTGTSLTFTKKVEILKNNIFGVDLDTKAVEIAQLNLLLKIAEKAQRLPILRANIKCGNSLIDDPTVAGDKSFKWEEKFKQIMQEGGFDVIVGNPPYVRIQTLDKKEVDFFNERYKSAEKGNYDIYVLFVEKGLALLKEDGYLGLILPHKFFTSRYGEPLRKLISEGKYLYEIVHFGDQQVFEGATTYTCLLFLRKKENSKFKFKKTLNLEKWRVEKTTEENLLRSSEVSSNEWNFVIGKNADLFKKLSSFPTKLMDVARIFQGLVTGADRVFVIDDNCEIEKSLIRPFLKSDTIQPYGYPHIKSRMVFPYYLKDGRAVLIPKEDFETKYPKTWNYFKSQEKFLRSRENGKWNNESWYAFGRSQNLTQMEKPKLIIQVLSLSPRWIYDDRSLYMTGGGGGPFYGLRPTRDVNIKYLLGILNSKLFGFIIANQSTQMRGGYIRFSKQYIEKSPIKLLNLSNPNDKSLHDRMLTLVDKVLSLKKRLNELGDKRTQETAKIEEEIKKIDAEIDEFVYEIYFYQILNEENHIIHGQFPTEHEPYAFMDAYMAIAEKDLYFETIVNVFVDQPGWADHMEGWMKSFAKDYIDILAIDHYPGTWTVTGADDWGPLDSLINICNKYSKKGAIMETGFSTWASEDTASWNIPHYWHTEDDQEIFINTALPIIKSKVYSQNSQHPDNRILLATWYELRGSEPYAYWYDVPWVDPHWYEAVENNFGILRDDWKFKRGYGDLQNMIREFDKIG